MLIMATVMRSVAAFAPSNGFRPYDQALRMPGVARKAWSLAMTVENGARLTQSRNTQGEVRSILGIYDDSQSLISGIFQPLSPMESAYKTLWQSWYSPTDDGKMANVHMTGSFKQSQLLVSAGYNNLFMGLPGIFGIHVHVPFVTKKIHDVRIVDQTPSPATLFRPTPYIQADLIQPYMKNFEANVIGLGGPSYDSWQRDGLGDLALMLDWTKDFAQEKEALKNVNLFAQFGFSMPTAAQRNEDKALSMSLGNDGAWGMPAGIGMHLDFINHLRAGVEADFLYLFDKSRVRRMKTHVGQTEFLLLNKGEATKEHGLLWQFHLYLEAVQIVSGFSARVGYQFIKKDRDRLVPRNNDFNYDIVNSARSLQESSQHNILARIDFDSAKSFIGNVLVPQVGIFYKYSLDAKGALNNDSFGAQLALHF